MLDYKLIEALAAVVQEGGFDRAARRLHLTQSAVSQRVKLLEQQTGQVLLVRSAPPSPTPPGKRMVKHFLQVNRLEDDLLDDMADGEGDGFAPLAVGVNADSLATWFLEAVRPFLEKERVVLDLRSEDQDRTHELLRDGEVIGCVSAMDKPVQGCRATYLGPMDYRLVATPAFAAAWFPRGLTAAAVEKAPAMAFNRKDTLHAKLYERVLERPPADVPVHYLPSSEKFAGFICTGLGCGMLPDQQSAHLLASGRLVDLAPDRPVRVDLFWHCWNLRSGLLDRLTQILVAGAQKALNG